MTQRTDEDRDERIVVRIDAHLEGLIPKFLKSKYADVTAVLEAMNRGDYEAIRIIAHKMRGSGGGYGFDAISEIGSSLEQGAKERNNDTIEQWAGKLRSYLNRVVVVFD